MEGEEGEGEDKGVYAAPGGEDKGSMPVDDSRPEGKAVGGVEKPEEKGRDTVLKRVALRKGISLEDARMIYGPMLDAAYRVSREDRERILPAELVEDTKALAEVKEALDPSTRQYVQLLVADKVEKALSGGGGRDARLDSIMDRVAEIKLQDTLVKGLILGGEEEKKGREEGESPAIQRMADAVAAFVSAVEKREEEKEKSLAEKAFEEIAKLRAELRKDKAKERRSLILGKIGELEQAIKAIQSQSVRAETPPPPGFRLRLSDGTVLEGEEAIKHWEEIRAERELERELRKRQFEEDLEDRRKERQLKEEKVKLLKEFPAHIIDAIDRVLQEEGRGGEAALSFEGGVLDVKKCPLCGTDIPIPRSHGGKVVCPNDKCNAVFKVTSTPSEEPSKR